MVPAKCKGLSPGLPQPPRDPLPQPSSIILGTHVTTCRARMNEALQALGAGVTPYTGEDLRGQVILGTHINEIIGRAY
ncbi:MAG: hypothetical protein ABI779_13820 [Acidobacteriota bacterium]